MKKSVRNLLIAVLILNLAFIWGNSLLDGDKSNALSDAVIGVMRKIVGFSGGGSGGVAAGGSGTLSFLVRKAAHMTEFLLLAVWAGMLDFRGKFLPQRLLFGIMTALTDETIQLYTGRTSLVTDVWIDFVGFIVGTMVVWFIARWRKSGG